MADNTIRLAMPSEGSHFYMPDSSPLYEVPNKSKPGEYRKATIRDAKAAGAVPSVTTILGVLDKPALTAWKINNAVLSALTLPRNDGESDDDFARRVVEDADSPSRDAADLGTAVHHAIESWIANREAVDAMAPYINPVDKWMRDNAITPVDWESICINEELRYGCRVDCIATSDGRPWVIDWKSQKSKNGKLTSYDDHCAQLIANATAAITPFELANAVLCNVYISTTDRDNDGNAYILVHVWDSETIVKQWEIFKHCRAIYRIKNGL